MILVPVALKALILPPAILLLAAALGWIVRLRWKRTGTALIVAPLLLLTVLSMPACSGWMRGTLESYPALTPGDYAPDVGAIVVLGADMDHDAPEYAADTVGSTTLHRLRYGAWLHRATDVPLLVAGGRLRFGHRPLAEVMAATLTDEFGVHVQWMEAKSPNTRGNAKLSADILNEEGIHKVYLVTSAYHMARAKAAFESVGLEVVPAPTGIAEPLELKPGDFIPRAGALLESTLVIHEWIGRVWYRMVY